MKGNSERREFTRFPVEFAVEIIAHDSTGKTCRERSTLKDICGGGAKFTTLRPDIYAQGQPLDIVVYLPGVKKLNASMKGKATVVRIEPPGHLHGKGTNKETGIAISFDTWLDFERADMERSGSTIN